MPRGQGPFLACLEPNSVKASQDFIPRPLSVRSERWIAFSGSQRLGLQRLDSVGDMLGAASHGRLSGLHQSRFSGEDLQ